MTGTVIGTATLVEGTTFLRNDFETASWWQEIECEPQTVDLVLWARSVWFTFKGTVVDEQFTNRVFSASSTAEKQLGVPGSKTFSRYMYQLDSPPDGVVFNLAESADGA